MQSEVLTKRGAIVTASCVALATLPTATASVTWLDQIPSGPSSGLSLDSNAATTTFSGAAALQAQSLADGGATASITAATSSGFSGSFANGAGGMQISTARILQVTAPTQVDATISMTSPSGVIYFKITDAATSSTVSIYFQLSPVSGSYQYTSGPISLSAGTYAIDFLLNDFNGGSGFPTGTSGTMSFNISSPVPAPGAIAVLGMAGLRSRRRRTA